MPGVAIAAPPAAAMPAAPAYTLPGWLAAVALIAATAVIGPSIGSPMRVLYVAAAVCIGVAAWRQSPAMHLATALVLFAFTPFARRVVDLSVGYDYAGIMIAAPLLVLLAPLIEVRREAFRARLLDPALAPHYIVGACVLYAAMMSLLASDWSQVVAGTIKWGIPLAYGVLLHAARPNPTAMVYAMTRAFRWIVPVMGVYGIYQYVDPPLWDRYWLAMASITSAGHPEPYQVRTFSTMHAPAAFATYTAVGLLLVGFASRGVLARVLLVPAAIALLLSFYRTAWLSLIAGIVYCLAFRATRTRALIAGALAVAVLAAVLAFVPFSDAIAARIGTMFDPAQDASGQERLEQFWGLYGREGASLMGTGFSSVDVGVPGAQAVDGMFIACWTSMGIVVGLICLTAILWIAAGAALRGGAKGKIDGVLLGALAFGFLVQTPLATIVSGELGFLFFSATTLALLPDAEAMR